ncbi:MAG: type IV secretion system protein, partial [Pseudomonadota bacterium]
LNKFVLVTVILFLSACTVPLGPICIEPFESTKDIAVFDVKAEDHSWVDTGVDFETDKTVVTNILGNVRLCDGLPKIEMEISAQAVSEWYSMDHIDPSDWFPANINNATNSWNDYENSFAPYTPEYHYNSGINSTKYFVDPLSNNPSFYQYPVISTNHGIPANFWRHLPYNAADRESANNLDISNQFLEWTEAEFDVYEPDGITPLTPTEVQFIRAGEAFNIRIQGRFTTNKLDREDFNKVFPQAYASEINEQSCSGTCSDTPYSMTQGAGLQGKLVFYSHNPNDTLSESRKEILINFDKLVGQENTSYSQSDFTGSPSSLTSSLIVHTKGSVSDTDKPYIKITPNFSNEAQNYFVTHRIELNPVDGPAKFYLRHLDAPELGGDNDYSNNSEGYTVKLQYLGCFGSLGKYLFMSDTDSLNVGLTESLYQFRDNHFSIIDGRIANILPNGDVNLQIIPPLNYINAGSERNYDNNSGFYRVSLTEDTVVNVTIMSEIFAPVIGVIEDKIIGRPGSGGLLQEMYEGQIYGATSLANTIRILLMILIIFSAIKFMLGFYKTGYDFLIILIKLAIGITLLGPDSWEFFSHYLFDVFLFGIGELASQFSSALEDNMVKNDGSAPDRFSDFTWFDDLISPFTQPDTWLRLIALLHAGALSAFYFSIIITAVIKMFFLLIKVTMIFLMSLISVAILIALAPIFISLLLIPFEKGKRLFTEWIKFLFSSALQPVLIVIVVSFFAQLIRLQLHELLNYSICYKCFMSLWIPLSLLTDKIPDLSICLDYKFLPWSETSQPGMNNITPFIPFNFMIVLMFYIYINLFGKFVTFGSQLASAISGDTGAGAAAALTRAASALYANSGMGYLERKASQPNRAMLSAGRMGGNALGRKFGSNPDYYQHGTGAKSKSGLSKFLDKALADPLAKKSTKGLTEKQILKQQAKEAKRQKEFDKENNIGITASDGSNAIQDQKNKDNSALRVKSGKGELGFYVGGGGDGDGGE